MQIGADRRRGDHRVRQPEVKRELRGFGERTEENQKQNRRVKRMASDRVAPTGERRQLVTPGRVAQKDQARQQRESATTRHQQRLQRRRATPGLLMLEADEQKRRQAGQFPEDEQGQDVVGQDQAEHRRHE